MSGCRAALPDPSWHQHTFINGWLVGRTSLSPYNPLQTPRRILWESLAKEGHLVWPSEMEPGYAKLQYLLKKVGALLWISAHEHSRLQAVFWQDEDQAPCQGLPPSMTVTDLYVAFFTDLHIDFSLWCWQHCISSSTRVTGRNQEASTEKSRSTLDSKHTHTHTRESTLYIIKHILLYINA